MFDDNFDEEYGAWLAYYEDDVRALSFLFGILFVGIVMKMGFRSLI